MNRITDLCILGQFLFGALIVLTVVLVEMKNRIYIPIYGWSIAATVAIIAIVIALFIHIY